MSFFAVGHTNGGANEKRIGPFGSVDEAKRNGIAEMNRNRGAFSFSGVVDEGGKYVFANSAPRSTNPVVANALKAKNSLDDGSVLVSFRTLTGNGLESVQKRMTASQFKEWMSKIGLSSKEHEAWESLMKSDSYAFAANPIRISVRAL